ncbi:hypothetical protein ENH_00003850 [Eimeria necatrix]|uniref:Integrase catalytic domain-containing protein n=1 Tax=Eimeria necatrix TaxID=51315 RepID=U6MI21_9EIME|nr:hypothetical protein ENH_00003850 [Eimeria necatrix]CDJ62084.1 hypothetical protein ENH_00003850 [Eimeria necatrix]
MAHFIPAKKSHSAADTVELLADRLIRYHGFPEVLISDRDPRFQSEVWSQLCSRFNITRAMSSSYHPQTDGQTERVNRTLEQMLRTYIQADEREWEGLLPALELAYNTTSHSSTELSPFEIMIGEIPLTAAVLDIVGALAPTLTPPMTKLFRQLCDRARSHILQAKWRQKYYADARRRAVEYKDVPPYFGLGDAASADALHPDGEMLLLLLLFPLLSSSLFTRSPPVLVREGGERAQEHPTTRDSTSCSRSRNSRHQLQAGRRRDIPRRSCCGMIGE